MERKVATAVGSDCVYEYLIKKQYEVIPDISYQEGVYELLKKEFVDVLIVYAELSGDGDKYTFIDKIRQIDSKIKIIIIAVDEDENYKKFLWSKGVFDIFIDGVTAFEELESRIADVSSDTAEVKSSKKNMLNIKNSNKKSIENNLTLRFQRQEIITFAGIGSSGKTTIACEFSKILAKNLDAKILLIDLDTLNAGLNQFMGIKKGPENPGYILSSDKNSSLNYMVDAIDKRSFNTNIFEKYVIKSKIFPNLDILTGNKSLYVCKNILSSEYYSRVLEVSKSIYDYIIIDTTSNVFLDSMQFSVLNATKVVVIAEGNYISLERNYRLLSEIFPVWGVHNKKIQIIINKYSNSSLDKTIIKELLKEFCISGYISFSKDYEENINSIDSKSKLDTREEYYTLLENLDICSEKDYSYKVKKLKQRFLGLKNKSYMLKNN